MLSKGIVSALLTLSSVTALATDKIVLYTDRPTARLQPAADQFFAKTGVQVEIVEKAYPELLAKLTSEGAETPADLIMTKDLVYLHELTSKGFFQPYESELIKAKVSENMRHPQDLWTATSFRTRTIAYNPATVDARDLSTYEDLATEKWAGRLCVRTSKHGYNEALGAEMIVKHGYNKAKEIIAGWVANLAVDPIKGDTAALEQMASGICDVAIVNHYYLAQLIANNPNFPIKIFFANQNTDGAHTNGTGIGILKSSKNAKLATLFMETLLDDQINLELSTGHFEFPAVKYLVPGSLIKDWGTVKTTTNNWSVIGEKVEEARNLFKEVGYL